MSRFIEHFLEKQLNEYRRKSKTILIVYKCRYEGLSKTRAHKKKKLSKNDRKEAKENNDTNSSGRTIHCSEQNSSEILDTILKTWSSTLETDISNFFEESSDQLSSNESSGHFLSPQEYNINNFPFDDPRMIKPVWYWNIETDNMKRRLDECCECNKKYKPKTPPLHLDTISRLRLQSFIRSLCEDKCNSRLCQPDEDTDKKTARCKRKKPKDKKGCKCKKDSSMVSFHITVPKQTKTVTLKNDDNTQSNKSRENSNETSKQNNEFNKCRNCPYFSKNSDAQSEPSNQGCLISEPGDVTLKLGNQTITISVKRVNGNEQNESKTPGTNSSQRCQNPSSTGNGEQNRKSRNSISPNVNSYQVPNGRDKTCECLQKMKKSVEEDLKKYVLSQLNINYQPDSDARTVQQPSKVKKCKYRNEESANSKKEEENQDLNGRCNQSCECGQSKNKKKNSNAPIDAEELEDDDVPVEESFRNPPIKKFARCVKICVEPQTGNEDESSEEQEEEYEDSKKQKRFGGTGGRELCKHNGCPWRKKEETESENYQEKSPKKSSLKCQCNDGSEKPSNRNRKNKCCSCSSNTEKAEKKKCECPKSKKKQPKSEDKCCQCQPNQDKDTQVEINKSSEQNIDDPEDTEDTTIVNEDKAEDDNTQSKKTSVAETYSVKTENSSRKQSKASAVEESDLEKKDESCSCCICDEESSDEGETSVDSDEDDEIPGSRRDSSRSQTQEEVCKCDSSDEEFTEEIRKKPILKNQKKSKNTRGRPKSFSLKFCGDSDDEDIFHSTKPSRETNKELRRKFTSTEDLIECDCGEFEQLITELEEYCRTKCVNFKLSQNPGFYESEKKLYSGKSSAEKSIFMVHKDSSTFPSFQKPSILSKSSRSFSEKKAFITSQDQELIRRNMNTKICFPRSRAPRKTSSKLSDQRLNRRRKIEAHYKKSRMEQIGFLLL